MLSGHGQAQTIVEAMKPRRHRLPAQAVRSVEELELAFQKALEKRALKAEVEELRGRARGTERTCMILGGDNAEDARGARDHRAGRGHGHHRADPRGERRRQGVVARTLFNLSTRRDRPFVKVNCAALPSELLESELFGFEKGAFTGAQKRKLGKFEYANHGTIFLDEISEMHPNLQAKLLQVLQDGEFSRLGGENDVQGRHARDRGHQPQPRGGGPGRPVVPRGSVLPAQRGDRARSRRCATASTRSRCSWTTSCASTTSSTIEGHSRRFRRSHVRVHASTTGRATCASSRTW